jgi:hypothetical protein
MAGDDYNLALNLSKQPLQMAFRIVAIERRIAAAKIGRPESAKETLKAKLITCKELCATDPESAHAEADDALLDFIDDEEISKLYGEITKWYG